jgi:Domain of unknown function (DUF1707)/2TM domain
MCYSTRKPVTRTRPTERQEQPWPTDPQARIGDAERNKTVDVLGDAAAEGYLDPDELDERLSAAFGALTVEDLRNLTRDLPPEWQAERTRRAAAATAQREARVALRSHVAVYLRVMAILVAVWLVLGITAGAWYPWPIWPAVGWGIALIAQARAATRPALERHRETSRVKIGA